jgi:Zn-dependent M28 family amino/carboxypeptidase
MLRNRVCYDGSYGVFVWRIILIITVMFGCLAFGLMHAIAALFPEFLQWSSSHALIPIINVLCLLSIVSTLILLGLKTDNRSPGALDNAGSVGTLLALAETLRHDEFQHIDVVFVSTGAEELGLLGAYAFLRAWGEKCRPTHTWFLNFDLLGVPGVLRLLEGARLLQRPRSRYARLIQQTAQQLGTPLQLQPILPGALLDHIPFSRQGFQATSLISVSKQSSLVHTEKDTIDLVDPQGLTEAGNLVMNVIQALENDISQK